MATLLLDASVDIRKVQDLLGLPHITTTQIYDKRRRSTSESASHDEQIKAFRLSYSFTINLTHLCSPAKSVKLRLLPRSMVMPAPGFYAVGFGRHEHCCGNT